MFVVHPVVYDLSVLQDKHGNAWEAVDYCTLVLLIHFPRSVGVGIRCVRSVYELGYDFTMYFLKSTCFW